MAQLQLAFAAFARALTIPLQEMIAHAEQAPSASGGSQRAPLTIRQAPNREPGCKLQASSRGPSVQVVRIRTAATLLM
jgi:hypothetical protein